MGKLFSSVSVEMLKFVLRGVVCFLLASYNLPLCHFSLLWVLWSKVGYKHRQNSCTGVSHRFYPHSPSICLPFCPSPGYKISYRLDSRDPQRWTTVEVGSNGRQFTVTGLAPEQTYVFRLIARTSVGWGEEQEALVVTTERRGNLTLYEVSVVICHSVVWGLVTLKPRSHPDGRLWDLGESIWVLLGSRDVYKPYTFKSILMMPLNCCAFHPLCYLLQ